MLDPAPYGLQRTRQERPRSRARTRFCLVGASSPCWIGGRHDPTVAPKGEDISWARSLRHSDGSSTTESRRDFNCLIFYFEAKTQADRDQFWTSPFTRSLDNAESNHASSEDQVAVAALFDTSGITSCRTVRVRPTQRSYSAAEQPDDMRIAPREMLPPIGTDD